MPIYEYKCKNCDNEFEMIRSANDDDRDVECPECGKKKVEKIMSVFAGSGGSCSTCSTSSCFT